MQAYVVPGTIADTMLRQMENSLKTTKGKKAVSEFWKTSDTIASTSIRYQKLKYQLQGQMAQEALDEVENRHKKKQRTIQLTESNEADGSQEEGDSDNQDDHNNTGVGDEDNDNDIWNSWKTLLKSLQESSVLPSLSPESHGIIWCGKKVLRRPLLPTNLYDQLNNEVPNIKLQCVHPSFRQIMLVALDTENKEAWLETVKKVQKFQHHYRFDC
ncbi:hypothetical protein RMCBS344292_10257 [Rhizopus microsporus]|nr:hypothetical protein RMCBS344292_10257 [Rhizopus microsporus]